MTQFASVNEPTEQLPAKEHWWLFFALPWSMQQIFPFVHVFAFEKQGGVMVPELPLLEEALLDEDEEELDDDVDEALELELEVVEPEPPAPPPVEVELDDAVVVGP